MYRLRLSEGVVVMGHSGYHSGAHPGETAMSVKSLTQRDLREVPAYSIAEAVGYLRRTFNTPRPLADEQLATDGVNA